MAPASGIQGTGFVRVADLKRGDKWEEHIRTIRERRKLQAEERKKAALALREKRRKQRTQHRVEEQTIEVSAKIDTLPFYTTSTLSQKEGTTASVPRVLRIVRLTKDKKAARVTRDDVKPLREEDPDHTAREPDDPPPEDRTLPVQSTDCTPSEEHPDNCDRSLERLKPLTDAERRTVERAVAADTVVEGTGYSLRGDDFAKLVDTTVWLDDTVVDAYVKLINARSDSFFSSTRDQGGSESPMSEVTTSQARLTSRTRSSWLSRGATKGRRGRTYAFGSYFFKILCPTRARYNYSAVRGWTSGPIAKKTRGNRERGKVRVLDYAQILVPVNVGAHWVLAVVDMANKAFVYLDSMYGKDGVRGIVKTLRRWLRDDVTDKYGEDVMRRLGIESWKVVENPEHLPRQTDTDSCGMFCLGLAERWELGRHPNFTQDDIPLLRKRAALALYTGALPHT